MEDHTQKPPEEVKDEISIEGDNVGVKKVTENLVFPTVHNIYNGKVDPDESAIITRSPSTKRSKINRLIYAKLHKTSHGNSAVDKLKGKYEGKSTETDNTQKIETKREDSKVHTVEQLKNKYSPASFGYPKAFSKIPKKVQFSNDSSTQIPVPKPRISKTIEAPVVTEEVKVRIITPEEPTRVFTSTSTLNSMIDTEVVKDENSNNIERSPTENALDDIEFAEPEDKHFIVRASSSEDSVTLVENTLSEFVMEGSKVKEKKRSGSFRRILSGSFFGGKDKKKSEKKQDNSESGVAFNRNSSHRHTISGGGCGKNGPNYEQNDTRNKAAEELFAQMHINKFNDIRNNFSRYNTRPNFPAEEYVCMDNQNAYRNQELPPKPLFSNTPSVDKYIDTSSSTSTLESEKQHNMTYENSLIAQAEIRQQQQQNENIRRAFKEPQNQTLERFTETPPRAHETYQNLQLVRPKAVIPISSERPLPNPYQNNQENDNVSNNLNRNEYKQGQNKNIQPYFDETYGTVFDSIENNKRLNSRVSTPSSPRSPSLEGSKLRLPSNRERIELQPRIKSPIPQSKISTDKIIATELLKSVRSPTPTRKSPSHQRLEMPIDYPEQTETVDNGKNLDSGVKTKPPVSPKTTNEWYKQQQPSPNHIIANAVVHAESNGHPQKASPVFNDTYRSITPVNQRLSTASIKSSPEKHEIRQQVEAYCWKELKKLKELKEKEEMDLYYYQLQTYGYADDAILNRRSRSLTPNAQRGGRRSLSLPREVTPIRSPQYGRTQQAIPEGRALFPQNRPVLTYGYLPQQQFVRNSSERRTIGPIISNQQQQQKPIFNRGSLTNQNFYENQASLKKVSFSPKQDNWPTRNGYTQSPPQRRLEKQKETVDDEAFLSPEPSPKNVQLRQRFPNESVRNLYGSQPQVKMEEIYIQKTVMDGRLPENIYGHSPKQVRVTNRICDNYGQIHDSSPKTGVMYGQLQPNPVLRPTNFVRGSRLTASANDMYKRYQNVDPRYRSDVVFQPIYETNYSRYQAAPNRPLPPVPSERSTSLLPRRNDLQYRVRGK